MNAIKTKPLASVAFQALVIKKKTHDFAILSLLRFSAKQMDIYKMHNFCFKTLVLRVKIGLLVWESEIMCSKYKKYFGLS